MEEEAGRNRNATFIASEPRSIEEALAAGLHYEGDQPLDSMHRDIPEDEIAPFADLLGKLLQYTPEDRLAAAGVLQHEWFKM